MHLLSVFFLYKYRGMFIKKVLAIMARTVVYVLALLALSGLSFGKVVTQKNADPVILQRQLDISYLLYHIHEPIHFQEAEKNNIVQNWDLLKNIESFSNVTAVKIYSKVMDTGLLPRAVPFSVLDSSHRFEAMTLFNVLYSAKDYQTLYNILIHLRNIVNEYLYVHVLSVVILLRQDTQGISIPPLYEVFPSFFFNGEIMTTAQRINTHGVRNIEHYPSTYVWNDNVMIQWNETVWPYMSEDNVMSYYNNDHMLNLFYYNSFLTYPSWLGGNVVPLVNDRRGEWFWFTHKQLLTRYYMERLSNGLGEIPVLGWNVVPQGYVSGLIHPNGIPVPVRPNFYNLQQPALIEEMQQVVDIELRLRNAIDSGYIINNIGEQISIRHPEDIDIIGRIIEASVDSPNRQYYRDLISLWKIILGGSEQIEYTYVNSHANMVNPSVLEQYQTALRDPAFYMIWKRVMSIFNLWQENLPLYKPEELILPSVVIQDVEVDKLVTYFENKHVNISNHLHMNEIESQKSYDQVSVLVQRPQLNHKLFQVRIHVNSDVAKTVVVRLFLAPKHDSLGNVIPLHLNTENFFLLDQFTYDLPQGVSVIRRNSTENKYLVDWSSSYEVYNRVESALVNKEQYVLDMSERIDGFPQRLLLPKGRVGGMPFVLMAYISEYRAPKMQLGEGFDPAVSLGLGSGARRMVDEPLGFPVNRPLHDWQIENVRNLWIEDVLIYHKHTPEIVVPHAE